MKKLINLWLEYVWGPIMTMLFPDYWDLQWYRPGVYWTDVIRALYDGKLSINDVEQYKQKADNWVDCACGMQSKAPKNDSGSPKDDELFSLGINFGNLWKKVRWLYRDNQIDKSTWHINKRYVEDYAKELMDCIIAIDKRDYEVCKAHQYPVRPDECINSGQL